ncbi:MAG TPA: UDP-N-acetylmuramate:L-alanyl-gamma-D-glutamyl-meso-diaminopimelate ligase [Terriglobales bacterium]|nr:UDP-N-acetylmuramate:L-alanyl-gamma-D-glutamyl-meso-diaminopimelate ligase [Terriglobales bacterium]
MSEQQHIHLIGICGTAMASLAGLLKQRGLRVTGSDAAVYPPMSEMLAALSIPVQQPYAESNLQPRPDLVVVGNAISRGNPELEYVLDQRIPLRSMPQVLYEFFLRGRESIVVAGTHGKTTTTAMLAWIFQAAGHNPSFLVGGVAENFASSFALKPGKHFILEGDEYDTAFFDKGPKFLHYFPDAAVLTSVEFDHADIYSDLEAVKTAFRRLVNLVPRRGEIVAFDADTNVSDCVSRALCRVERYGFREGSHWRATDIRYEPACTRWSVMREGQPWAEFEFPLAGEYNVLNATAAAAVAAEYDVPPATIGKALREFKGVKRRLEVRGEVNGVTFVEDFAHHPTAIAGTLQALRMRYPGRRLWVLFEPRSNTLRRNVFAERLVESLALADRVVIADIFRPEVIPEAERLDLAKVLTELGRRGTGAQNLADADTIATAVAPELRPGDVVAILSNGGFGGIYEKLPQRLKNLSAVSSSA